LLPMVFQLNVDFAHGAINFGSASSEWWVQLATAVVFGLAFSTIMILLVTPVWLLVPYRVGRWTRRMKNRLFGRRSADAVQLVTDGESKDRDRILPAAE
ncbi:MAG: hypothetical protein RH945_05005, partial [Hyphomonas sp.]